MRDITADVHRHRHHQRRRNALSASGSVMIIKLARHYHFDNAYLLTTISIDGDPLDGRQTWKPLPAGLEPFCMPGSFHGVYSWMMLLLTMLPVL
jgi:hypothetical protein